VEDIMKGQFLGNGSVGPSNHLFKIEWRCTLFKLSCISQEVNKKIFYVSLNCEARNWYYSLKHIDIPDWELSRKVLIVLFLIGKFHLAYVKFMRLFQDAWMTYLLITLKEYRKFASMIFLYMSLHLIIVYWTLKKFYIGVRINS
jgi:hypothetical protein